MEYPWVSGHKMFCMKNMDKPNCASDYSARLKAAGS